MFGILELILGVLCALIMFGIIGFPSLQKYPAPPMNAGSMARAAFPAFLLIWTGIGSMKIRRWARALSLIIALCWLLAGISGLILMFVFLPHTHGQMSQSVQAAKEAPVFGSYLMLGLKAVIYVIVPAIFILFYASPNVKATCELRDPVVRWTDKCPLPVLTVSMMYGLAAGLMLSRGLSFWAIPFFGFVLSGWAGSAAALINILLLSYVAWGTYKLKITAWWCAVFMTAAWALSATITLSRVSLWDFYEKMNFPKQYLEIMTDYIMPHYSSVAMFSRVWVVCILGYLLFVKKYFSSRSA